MYTPPFDITNEVLQLVSDISLKLGYLEALSETSLPSPTLRKANRIRTIHSSLAIEHNSLSLKQVTDIINGKHVLGAPDEIKEVKNAIDAYHLMQSLDAHDYQDLLKAHGAMMHSLVQSAGKFRSTNVGVFDDQGHCIHMAPPSDRVQWLIKDLFDWVSTTQTHPLISSCVFHYEFEFIHPFEDGNGRMGRFWQTMLLSRWKPVFAWLPVESIVHNNQNGYYAAIAQSDHEANSTPFIVYMLRCLLQAIEEHEQTDSALISTIPQLTKSEKKLLDELRKDGLLTISELSEKMGLSQSGVKKIIQSLKKTGLLNRIGASKSGKWIVNDTPQQPI